MVVERGAGGDGGRWGCCCGGRWASGWLPLEGGVHGRGCCCGGWRRRYALRELELGELLEGVDGGAIGSEDLHAEEMAGSVFLEAHHHGFEHLEGFFLVSDERILLRVAAEADAFLEVIHVEEVLFPEAVEDGEHDDALVVAHAGRRRGFFP